MSYDRTKLARLAVVVAAVAALSVGMSQSASAQAKGNPAGGFARGVVHSQNARIGTFNWLAKRSQATPVRYAPISPRVTRQVGNGSWICSPAGFGRKSRCFSN